MEEIPMPTPREAIAEIAGMQTEAIRQGNAAGFAEHYTDDALLMFQHMPTVAGRAAILGFWQGIVDMGAKDATLETDDLLEFGDTLVERGHYTLTIQSDAGETVDAGKFVIVWKREHDAWKLHWDIFNSDLPA
jgi:ketosteroid isomerase-like protein